MQVDRLLTFGPYRWNPQTRQLWRGKQEVRLTGKASAVLSYLVERAGQIVTKDELFAAVWPETMVSDAALSSCIQEVRRVLREQAKRPRYIATVHRRGFQFIGNVANGQYPVVSREETNQKAKGKNQKVKIEDFSPAPSPQHPAPTLVGRVAELTQLHGWLDKALGGNRQLVFVTGEAGIGKTSLLEAFAYSLASRVQRPASEKHEESQRAKVKGQKSKVLGPRTPNSELLFPDPHPLTPVPWLARGQCIEHYGAGEAYLPVLEALGRLCREADGQEVIAILRQQAPTWLVQMPALLSTAELEELQQRTAGATRERMLRELAEALEALTAERALILRLEDLHWSDYSTLDLLSVLARRQEAAQLLIVGTYRPVEVLTRDHPLKGVKQELQLHGRCEELALDFLSEAAVADYLVQRFNTPSPASAGEGRGEGLSKASLRSLAQAIHRRTDGNPLFMVNVVNDLVAQGVLAKTNGEWELRREEREHTLGTPLNLRQLIEQQIERVSSEAREVLEAASVAGAEFSAAAVAAAVEQLPETVEAQCEALVRREQFLRTREPAEWPDGTVAARYQFLHVLYQEVLYERIPAARRSRLHRLIGERTEAAYGTQAREIAAELAVHFERGRDPKRAIQYLQQAGENATRRSAHQEAISLLIKGLELLKTLPDTPERAHHELTLQLTLGASQLITKGYASREVEHTYSRARALCRQVGETPQLFTALGGLWQFYLNRAEFQTVCELGEELLTLAQTRQAPDVLLMAHDALGKALHWRGELAQSQTHVEQVIALYDPQHHRALTFLCAGEDPGVVCLEFMAWNLWLLGYPEQALSRAQQALVLAQEVDSPFDVAVALWAAAVLHQWRGDRQQVQERAEAMVRLSTEQGFQFWLAYGTMLRGWVLAEQGQVEEGIAQLEQGLAACRATGTEGGPIRWLPWLAAAYAKAGQAEKGLAVLAEASARIDKTGMCFGEAELYRLKGELTLQQFKVPGLKFKVEESVTSSVQTNQKAKSKEQKAKITSPQPLAPNTQGKVEQEAEGYFLEAIEMPQRQQAKSWELRASMSLTRLWQRQGKKKQAHTRLSEVYNWFTEGFDTKDLQEAKALLEELV